MQIKKISKIGITVATLLVGGLAAAPAASASSEAYVCASNQLCFYSDANFSGTAYVAATIPNPSTFGQDYCNVADANLKHYTNGASLDNSISSYSNSGSLDVSVWSGTSFTGVSDFTGAHLSIRQVSTLNDQISSFKCVAGF